MDNQISPFSQISDKEFVIMAKSMQSSGQAPDEILDRMHLIDKLLITQKSYSLLKKKKGLKNHLSAVIGNHVGQSERSLIIQK